MRLALPLSIALLALTSCAFATQCRQYSNTDVEWHSPYILLNGSNDGNAKSWMQSDVKINDPTRNVDDFYNLRLSVTIVKGLSIEVTHKVKSQGKFRQFLFLVTLNGGRVVRYWKEVGEVKDLCIADVNYSMGDVQSVLVTYRE
jgi:hypothetical protein